MSNIPITPGSGAASVATETVGGLNYQKIEVYGGGGASVLGINPDGSANVSIIGTPTVIVSGNSSVSGTVGASIVGVVPVTQSGTFRTSIISSTPSSVLVGASIFGQLPGGTAVLGSVAALQGTNPWIITGSIQGTLNTGNSSVQVLNFPTNQNVSGSVVGFQGTNPWIITGSVQAAISTGNSSVQVLNFPTTQNVSGSVVASQGTTPWVITGSVQGATSPANQSVSGTVGASVIGTVPTTQSGTRITSILGSYTEPQVVTSITGVALVYKSNVSTSVMTGVSVANPLPVSVQGTVNIGTGGPVSVTGTMSVLGTVPVTIVSGSIAALQSPGNSSTITIAQSSVAVAIVSGSIAATFTPPANQSVSGAVQISGASPASIMVATRLDNQVVGSMVGIVGQMVIHGITNVGSNQFQDFRVDTGTGAIMASVVGLQGASVSGTVGASVIGIVPVQLSNSSVITVIQASSIVGTYAEDTAHTTGDKGLLSLNVRNDTLASVTSADGDYGAQAVGPSGEGITANAPLTQWIRGTADLRVVQGASVTAIAAQGASVFTYITGIQLANMGSASVLVTFAGGLGSILGYSIAPAGGGSNILYPNALKTGENSAFTASINGVASVLVSAQGFTAKI